MNVNEILVAKIRSSVSDVQGDVKNVLLLESANVIERLERELQAARDCAEQARQMLDYIEMTTAYTGAKSVEQVMASLARVKQDTARLEIAHHLGCPATTRSVDLEAARWALAEYDAAQSPAQAVVSDTHK